MGNRMEPDNPTPTTSLPRGLVFFTSTATPAHRRRRRLFLVFYLLAGSAVLWPVYPWFASAEPRILGLPLAFAWVVGALLAIFAALLWLYLGEDDPRSAESVTENGVPEEIA